MSVYSVKRFRRRNPVDAHVIALKDDVKSGPDQNVTYLKFPGDEGYEEFRELAMAVEAGETDRLSPAPAPIVKPGIVLGSTFPVGIA